jgi:hypothetical protein
MILSNFVVRSKTRKNAPIITNINFTIKGTKYAIMLQTRFNLPQRNYNLIAVLWGCENYSLTFRTK